MTSSSPYRGGGRCRNEFGAYLLRHGIKTKWLSFKLGVHEQTVRSWRMMVRKNGVLRPRRTPELGTLEAIARVLQIDPTETLTAPQRVLRMIRRPVSTRQEEPK